MIDETARRLRPGFVIVGILLVAANLRASITVVGPLLTDVRADAGLGSAAASALISVPLLAFAAFSPIVPRLALRFGMEQTIAASLVLLAAGIVTRSLPWAPALWIGTAALGVAIAIMNVLLPGLLKRDFPREVGRLTGVYSAVQSAFAAASAGFAVPIAGAVGEGGWRLAFGIWAGLALIALGVFAPQLRARPAHPARPADLVDATGGRLRSPWTSAIGWQTTVFMGLQSTVFYVAITWLPSIEHTHGVNAATAGWHQSAFQVFGIFGTLLSAALLHRWYRDQRALVTLLSVISAVGIAGVLFAPVVMLLWVVVIGFAQGGLIVLALALFGLRTRHHEQAAAMSGMAQSVGYLLAAAGPLTIGALHDATGAWTVPLIVMLGVVVVQYAAGYLACRDRVLR
jgi:CP family cyanate transporter-like MFS transporter